MAAVLCMSASSVMAQTYSDGDSAWGASDGDSMWGTADGDSEWGDDDGDSGGGGVRLRNPLAADNITELFQTIIDIVLVFAIPLIVFFIIYAGFLYVTARGNEGTIEKAHKALLYALVGGLLILGANVLIQVVQGTVDCVRDLDGECSP